MATNRTNFINVILLKVVKVRRSRITYIFVNKTFRMQMPLKLERQPVTSILAYQAKAGIKSKQFVRLDSKILTG